MVLFIYSKIFLLGLLIIRHHVEKLGILWGTTNSRFLNLILVWKKVLIIHIELIFNSRCYKHHQGKRDQSKEWIKGHVLVRGYQSRVLGGKWHVSWPLSKDQELIMYRGRRGESKENSMCQRFELGSITVLEELKGRKWVG